MSEKFSTAQRMMICANAGLSIPMTAIVMGMHTEYLRRQAKEHAIIFRPGSTGITTQEQIDALVPLEEHRVKMPSTVSKRVAAFIRENGRMPLPEEAA